MKRESFRRVEVGAGVCIATIVALTIPTTAQEQKIGAPPEKPADSEARDHNHSGCFRPCSGPGQAGAGQEPGASRRQLNGHVNEHS
jgi:hypothetical protein